MRSAPMRSATRSSLLVLVALLTPSAGLASSGARAAASAPFNPQPAQTPPVVVSVTAPAGDVPPFGIATFKMNLSNVTTNPWEAVNITLALVPPAGARPLLAPIKGYHQGGSEWRARAALQAAGAYAFTLRVTWFNASSGATLTLHSSSGAVACAADAPPQLASAGARGFLRPRYAAPPYRTQYDDGSLFAGFGLGDCLNTDLTFPTYNETNKQQFNRSLTQYMGDYADAGFNIFRWSDGNCAFSITEALDGNPDPSVKHGGWRDQGNVYNEAYCALVDKVFDTLRAHGFSIWAVVFEKNSRPAVFPNMNESNTKYHVAQQQAIARHLDFVQARWGAQVDVWSLLNEQRADASWYAYAAGYMRSADPYGHPVSSSWDDHINMTQLQIDSVHWYYCSDTTACNENSDKAMADVTAQHLANGKPVYFTETGNEGHNWDPDSHTRMRLRSWAAFFSSASLLWWNTAGTQSYAGVAGNMYLGPTERSYQRVLRNFTERMRDPAVQAINVTAASSSSSAGVRAYGLTGAGSGASAGKRVLMAFAHHTDHSTAQQASLSFVGASIGGCSGVWVDPQTGNTTSASLTGHAENVAFTSPPFAIDIGLVLSCAASVPTPVPPTPVPPTPRPVPPQQSCNASAWKSGVILGDGQMAPVLAAPNASSCCARCASTAGCGCWTFVTSGDPHKALQCILKSVMQCSGSRTEQSRVSGTVPPPSPPPSPPPPSPGSVGGTRYKHWGTVQGANYVPSYSTNDVKDVFRPGFWNTTVVDRELGYASRLGINSLRVFVGHGGYASDNKTAEFLANYVSFQRLAKARGLSLLVTLGTGERSPFGTCAETISFVNAIVGAELPGAVIAYEADNEPTADMIDFLVNCTLPALNTASRNPDVDISVGLAHVGQVTLVKDLVTTLNWHSYNGKDNGGGLYGEVHELQKYVNKFTPPKQLVLTEYLARPAQPLAAVFPVLRANGVAAYSWALIIVDCTSHWNMPVAPGDPPFQGLLWPNGSAYDELEEVECLRTQCTTLQYVHHCCNNWHANGTAHDHLWSFSGSNGSEWQTKVFGSPVFKLSGPREGSMRWTNVPAASFSLAPLPTGTKRVALYLPTSPHGADFRVQLDGKQIFVGTTRSNTSDWVARTVLQVAGGKTLTLSVSKTLANSTQFSVSGVTLFST